LGAVAFTLGGLYLHALIAPRYESASSADVLVFGCFFGGAFCCLGMSATYHLLCNHSEEVARWGNKLDYTGIVFLIVGSYVPALWYGFYCRAGLLTGYLGAVSYPFSLYWKSVTDGGGRLRCSAWGASWCRGLSTSALRRGGRTGR
jgi:adiponectin receptor